MTITVCPICNHSCSSIKYYIFHCKFHRNLHNVQFRCPIPTCERVLQHYGSFKSHISRDHALAKSTALSNSTTFCCTEASCGVICGSQKELYSHLRHHIERGLNIRCPFTNCPQSLEFSKKSSFSSHVCRKHTNKSSVLRNCQPVSDVTSSGNCLASVNEENNFEESVADIDADIEPVAVDIEPSQYERSLALFYLKLQAKHILPASIFQDIIDDFYEVHSINKIFFSNMLFARLQKSSIASDRVKEICDELLRADLLRNSNLGLFRSDQTRKTYYKSNFNYVTPH